MRFRAIPTTRQFRRIFKVDVEGVLEGAANTISVSVILSAD